MKHDFDWNVAGANEMCLSCDNCDPTKCTWIDHNEMYAGTVFKENKIYLCPKFMKDEKAVENYEKHVSEAFVQAMDEYQKLKKAYSKEHAMAERGRKLRGALKDLMESKG